MATVTDEFREALRQTAIHAAAAFDGAVTRTQAESAVSATLESFLGEIEIPRAVLEYYVNEYLTVVNRESSTL